MVDIPHKGTNNDENLIRVISGRDYRLNFDMSTYGMSMDYSKVPLILRGIDALKAKNKPCVGHLVSLSDNELRWLVGDVEVANALRDWQVEIIGIPRDARVFGWSPPSQPLMGLY